MDAKSAALQVLIKMAIQDGKIEGAERASLELFATAFANSKDLDALIETARSASLETLCQSITIYADKFFVAFRAFAMAHCDAHYDVHEKQLYERLTKALNLTTEDMNLIQSTVIQDDQIEPTEPDPRIQKLFTQSSFAQQES